MARKRATDLSKTDMTMLVLIVLLVIFGLAVLFSSSEYNGRVRFGDSACYFKKQLFATALGMGVMYKVAVILFLAWQIERTKKATMGFGFMCRTILTLLPIIGLVGSNNLSTAIIILGIGGILIFVSNPGYLEFIGLGSAGAGFIAVFLAAESYRLERLAIWRNPEKYEKGFQTIQGLYAIGSGGIFGRGFGNSLQKLGFVPEAQNDMIFSIICEEMGAAGAIFLIFLFAMLLWRLGVAAMHAKDLAGALICCGIMGHLALQVILNIAVVTNTIPNTGITLPFISYGGTSAVFLLGEMGLAMNVGKCDRIN